jgi:hypothetical protein
MGELGSGSSGPRNCNLMEGLKPKLLAELTLRHCNVNKCLLFYGAKFEVIHYAARDD